jgi:uncharacterized protein YndB with AHSA1/START domain
MVVVSRSVHIDAPVERVFALMADPLARSRLSPTTRPIRAEIETDGPLREGSICHFRLAAGNRILDYRTRVREFVPDRTIVAVSDSAVPFEVQIETQPEDSGARLTQTERFEATDELLREALPRSLSSRVLSATIRLFQSIDTDAALELRGRQEEELAQRLEGEMDRWLLAIKHHLEDGGGH